MTLDNMFSIAQERLLPHQGHAIVIANYGNENIAIECETCYEVLVDFTNE